MSFRPKVSKVVSFLTLVFLGIYNTGRWILPFSPNSSLLFSDEDGAPRRYLQILLKNSLIRTVEGYQQHSGTERGPYDPERRICSRKHFFIEVIWRLIIFLILDVIFLKYPPWSHLFYLIWQNNPLYRPLKIVIFQKISKQIYYKIVIKSFIRVSYL